MNLGMIWATKEKGGRICGLHFEAFECALRRLQPLNWDTAICDIFLNKVEGKKSYDSHETVFMVHSGNCILASFHFPFILGHSKSRIKLNLPETPRSHIIRLACYFVSTLYETQKCQIYLV